MPRRPSRARPARNRVGPLVVNPSLDLALLFAVPVPGQGMSKRVLQYAEHPEVISALAALRAARGAADLTGIDRKTIAFLRAEHLLVRADAPKRPTFRVDASQPLRDLVPSHPLRPSVPTRDTLAITPALVLQRGPRRPATLSLSEQLPAPNTTGQTVLWVPDARTQHRRPFWPSRAALQTLERYRRGAPVVASAETEELTWYGALGSPAERQRAGAAWRKELAVERRRLGTHGYAILRGLLSGLQLAGLRQYTRALRAEGYFTRELGNRQVEGRQFIYQEPAASSLHAQLAAIINELAPEPVKPSYCYLATSERGAVLRRHVDREQCVWNLSLVLDAEPELAAESMWPIYLDVKPGPARAALGIGDAVLYSGTRVPHWREALSQHEFFTACFYHFVPTDFSGPLG